MSAEETVLVVIIAIIFWCLNKKAGYIMCFTLLFSTVVNMNLKDFFSFERPIGQPGVRSLRVETATGSSFPSGHTQVAATFWTSLWLNYRKKLIGFTGLFLMCSVAISRLYLGVHWPRDVIASLIIGPSCAILFYWLSTKYEKYTISILAAGLLLPSLLGLFYIDDPEFIKILALITGLFMGYLVETKHIQFETHTNLKKNILKAIFGIIGLLLLKSSLKLVLPPGHLSDFIRYTLVGLWVTALWPLCFKKLNY